MLAVLVVTGACDDDTSGTPDAATGDSAVADAPQSQSDGASDGKVADDKAVDDKGTGDGPQPGADGPKASHKADDVLKACTLFGSCIPDDGVNDCLRDFYEDGEEVDSAIPCLAKAASTGCAAVKSCLGLWFTVGAPCGPGKHVEVCQSTTEMVSCDDSLAIHVDCPKLFGAGVGCKNDACSAGSTCTGTSSTCKGGYAVDCKNGQEEYEWPPCPLVGLKCQGGSCVGPDEACTTSKCEGDVAALCVNGGFKRLDCAALGPGFTCKTTASGVACRQGTQCDPATSKKAETCNGDKLTVCHAGKIETVDCKALGFSGCGKTGCLP
jgi:hypothetical protein